MKKALIIILLLTPFLSYSQDFNMPLKDGKVFYEEVSSVDSVTKDKLYINAKLWLAETFKDSKEVIQIDDKESGRLTGKGLYKVYRSVILNPSWYDYVHFTINIDLKDNKYRCQIYDINYENGGTYKSTYDIETIYDYYKTKKIGRKSNENTLMNIDSEVKKMLSSLKSKISQKAAQDF